MIECPCRYCSDRCVGCHSDCDRYNGWRKEVNEHDKPIKDLRHKQRVQDLYKMEAVRRCRRKK